MAPFNQRQIGYIQAIAGRQQHRTLICDSIDEILDSGSDLSSDVRLRPYTLSTDKVKTGWQASPGGGIAVKSLLMHNYLLDVAELGFDSRASHVNSRLESADFENLRSVDIGFGRSTSLNVFVAPVKGSHAFSHLDSNGNRIATDQSATGQLVANPERIKSVHRATQDGFLNSTDVKFRFTLPATLASDSQNPMGQNHYEFRWIVWRSKRPTLSGATDDNSDVSNLEAIRDGVSLRNPGYDFFMGQSGRKRGFLGYTLNKDLDKEKITDAPDGEAYSGAKWNGASMNTTGASFGDLYPTGEERLTVDDLMTMRINRDDYVVMKDVRFFLGKEHGKSHFEDNLHWDWNDPIDTPEDNVLTSPTLNSKNYRWHMTLLGTSGGSEPCQLLSSVRWTTKMESG